MTKMQSGSYISKINTQDVASDDKGVNINSSYQNSDMTPQPVLKIVINGQSVPYPHSVAIDIAQESVLDPEIDEIANKVIYHKLLDK